jgi:hypothetical protein
LAILNGDGSSVVETVFVPTLAGLDKGFGEAGVIGGLPVLDKTSCFANWLFQKSSFFIWEFDWVPLFQVQDARGIPFTGLSTRRT